MSGILASIGLAFNVHKAKPALQMAVSRFSININRKTNQNKNRRREIASLLAEGKEEKARIRVETVIREEFTIEAYEVLSLMCELLVERMRLIDSQPECPPDLVGPVSSLLWASDRAEVTELETIRDQFRKKYGKEFVDRALSNEGDVVNPRVLAKLGVTPPSALLVEAYLKEIAREHNVAWEPTDVGLSLAQMAEQAMPGPDGSSIVESQTRQEVQDLVNTLNDKEEIDYGPPPLPGAEGAADFSDAKPAPAPSSTTAGGASRADATAPAKEDDSGTGITGAPASASALDYDSLAARFEALKRS